MNVMDRKLLVFGNTSQIEGAVDFPNMPEDMEVDEDNKNELMTTKNGNIINFLRKPEEGMEVNVCLGKSDVNISILKKGRETSKERERRNLREYRVVPGRDDGEMVVDIKTGKQGVESHALELSRSDVVKLEIKGKVHLMEPTSQSYSGCHSKCTVFKDINNTGFEAAHKMATDNDIEMCLYLKDTNIPPQVYRIIPRTGGKAHIFMEFISPSVSLYSVITEHMSVLEGKGMEKTFTYRAIIYLLKAFIIMKAKGISHGDLHAGNILIQLVINDFVPRFIDFEFSRIILGNSRGPDRDFSFISTVIADLCKAACKRSGDDLLNRFIEYKLEIHNIEEATRIIRETELHATLYATGNAEMIKVFSDIVHDSETADKFTRLHIGKKNK